MVKEPSMPCYLSIAGGRVGFIPFPRILALREMQLPRPGFELGVTSPFPMTLTISPRASYKKENTEFQPALLRLKIALGWHPSCGGEVG